MIINCFPILCVSLNSFEYTSFKLSRETLLIKLKTAFNTQGNSIPRKLSLFIAQEYPIIKDYPVIKNEFSGGLYGTICLSNKCKMNRQYKRDNVNH